MVLRAKRVPVITAEERQRRFLQHGVEIFDDELRAVLVGTGLDPEIYGGVRDNFVLLVAERGGVPTGAPEIRELYRQFTVQSVSMRGIEAVFSSFIHQNRARFWMEFLEYLDVYEERLTSFQTLARSIVGGGMIYDPDREKLAIALRAVEQHLRPFSSLAACPLPGPHALNEMRVAWVLARWVDGFHRRTMAPLARQVFRTDRPATYDELGLCPVLDGLRTHRDPFAFLLEVVALHSRALPNVHLTLPSRPVAIDNAASPGHLMGVVFEILRLAHESGNVAAPLELAFDWRDSHLTVTVPGQFMINAIASPVNADLQQRIFRLSGDPFILWLAADTIGIRVPISPLPSPLVLAIPPLA